MHRPLAVLQCSRMLHNTSSGHSQLKGSTQAPCIRKWKQRLSASADTKPPRIRGYQASSARLGWVDQLGRVQCPAWTGPVPGRLGRVQFPARSVQCPAGLVGSKVRLVPARSGPVPGLVRSSARPAWSGPVPGLVGRTARPPDLPARGPGGRREGSGGGWLSGTF